MLQARKATLPPTPSPQSSNKKPCSVTPQPWPTDIRLCASNSQQPVIRPELPSQSSLCWLAVVVDTSLQHMQGEKLVCASSPVNHTGLHIRARAERRTDQQPSTIVKGRQGNTRMAGGCSSIPATTDPTPSVSCQDRSRWLSSRQRTGHSRLNYHLFTKFTTGPSEPPPLYQVQNWSLRTTTSLPSSELVPQNRHLFTKFRTDPSEPPPLYQVQNWSLRTATSLPNSELVHQNHQLFTKFRIGPSEPPIIYQIQNCPSEPPPIYQIQNWSLNTAIYLPNSELVPQNHHLFTKFATGPSELPSGLPNSELSLCQVSSLTTKHLLQACLLPNNLRDQSWQAALMPFNSL